MNVMITGSAGFIGFHQAKSLLDLGYEVIGIDNMNDYYSFKLKSDRLKILQEYDNFNFKKIDIDNHNLLSNVFDEYTPNKVINLAAQAGVQYSISNPSEYIKSNLIGFFNMIELSKKHKVENFIYASSSSVYGSDTKIPFSVHENADRPLALYGATKRSNEIIAYSYSNIHGLNTTGLRYFTVYGPWYRPDMAIFIFIKKILNNEIITIYNNGNLKRDFTYVDDIISGTTSALNHNYKYEIFNLGNNNSIKIMYLIELLEKKLNKKANIKFETLKSGDMIETCADIENSTKKLQYKPKISIEKGVEKLINWYRNYYNV
tara:strand:+ start:206 stop:1159 length:954 start_codon:yes stop_codon:yes gene_type:complete